MGHGSVQVNQSGLGESVDQNEVRLLSWQRPLKLVDRYQRR